MSAELSLQQRAAIATTWAHRARYEREAEQTFRRFAAEFEQIEGAHERAALARTAAMQSAAHALRAHDVALAYGESGALVDAVDAYDQDDSALTAQEQLLAQVVAFACVNETLHAALRQAALSQTRNAEIASALSDVLANEVTHARVGWLHLSSERQQGRGAFLGALLPTLLQRAYTHEILRAPGSEDEGLAMHGELSRAARIGVFRMLVEDAWILGFERFGVETHALRVWADKTLEST